MKIICIVVTYNGIEWIHRCLESLRTSLRSIQILVVDNLSTDSTVSYIESHFPEVILVQASANLGFGKANNIGLKKALEEKADYVFLLNQDAYIAPSCIDNLVQVSIAHKEYGVISPFHLNYPGDAIEDYFNKYIIAIEAPGYISDLRFGNLKEIYSVSFVHAAGWLLPIETVKKVGGFDPLFFHYGEDNDYVQRALFKGFKIGFVPRAVMYHYGTNPGLSTPEHTYSFKKNFATIHLKNPKASFAGAIVVFTKGIFDGITSAILCRNASRIKTEWKLARNVIKCIGQIKRSRQIQLHDAAYLQN